MKKKITLFTLYDTEGASSKYRFLIYKKDLESQYDLKVYPFWNNKYVSVFMNNKKRYMLFILAYYIVNCIKRIFFFFRTAINSDVVIYQKAFIPKSRINFNKLLRKKNIRTIFDVDDAIYLSKHDTSNLFVETVDCVTVGNESLKQHYQNINNNTIIIPTTDNTNMYESFYKDTFKRKVIGWIGSQSTIDNLDLIVKPVNDLISRFPEVEFRYISYSAMNYEELIHNAKFIKWSEKTTLSELSKFTIGIMPLKDNEMNNGKCGFKLVQYLNMKKPVIASDIGVNRKIVNHSGYIVNSDDEWLSAFESLLFNEKKYNECIKNIETEFFQIYHYDCILKQMLDVIESNERSLN